MRLKIVCRASRSLILVLLTSLGHRLYAQPYTFTHYVGPAGGGSYQDGPGNTARFTGLIGVAVDRAGNVYGTDWRTHEIRKISPAGVVTTLAGSPGNPGTTDGVGPNARFSAPQGISADPFGNIYVADSANNTIRKIACDGTVSTFAGQAGVAGSADGTGSAALFNFPESLATDADGNIYVTDSFNETIRRITPGAVVTTVAGTPGVIGSADGTGSAASFNFGGCEAIAVDSAATLYVADCGSSTIRKITPARVVTTLAGTPGVFGSADGTGPAAQFENPEGIATDGTSIYVADSGNSTIRKITPSGVVTTVAGVPGVLPGWVDGVGAAARFDAPIQMASDGTSLFVADLQNYAVRKMAFATFAVTTLAGGSPADGGSADGTGTAASFNHPAGITTDGTDLYVADLSNSKIRKIVTATGQVSTLAGVTLPQGITSDGTNLYVVTGSATIGRIVIATGQVTTLAGTPGVVGSADGTGAAASFNRPAGITTDGTNLYVTDSTPNNTIRKIVIATAEVTTLAGTARVVGSADGTGGAASFNRPIDITTDGTNLFVADSNNHTIRKIVIATRQVTTFAGTAGVVGSADGTGGAASFGSPNGITNDGTYLYVSDSQSVRRITLSGAVVTTIGGKSGSFGATDGTGPVASFLGPRGITIVGGNLYVADSSNNMIRRGTLAISDVAAIDSPTGDRGVARQLSTTGGQATAWSWSLVTFPEGSTATFSDPAISNPTFTPDQPGLYRFRLDATGPAGRSITTVDLSVLCSGFPTAPPVSNNGPICDGQTLQLTAGSVPGGLYCWTGPNGFASSLQNPSIPSATTAASGTYSLTVSVSGCTSGVATTTATVIPRPASPIASNNGPICAEQTLHLTASTVAGASYSWTGPGGFTSTEQNPQILSAPASASGTYSVTATVDTCPSAPGITIAVVNPLPSAVIAAPSTVCRNAPGLSASVPSAGAGATYGWSILNGMITSGAGSNSITFAAGGSGSVQLDVTVTDGNGCSAIGTTSLPIVTGPSCGGQNLIPDGRAVLSTLVPEGNVHSGPVLVGRSYCVEVEVPFDGAGTLAGGGPLPVLSVTRADGVTAIGSGVSASCEPGVASRVTFTPAAADLSEGPLQFHITDSSASGYPYRVRLTETTMFCARWSVNSYTALIDLQNTSDCTVAGQVLILNSSGVTLTALPFNLLPGAATQFPVPTGLSAIFGPAILRHDGPPGAILGGIYMAQTGGTGGANFRWPFLAIRSYGSTDGR